MTRSLVVAKLLNMKNEIWETAEKVSEILTTLAHPVRLIIVCSLLQKEMCATQLLELVGTSKGNISQHLKLLLLRKLIHKRKDGNRIYYRIADPNLENIIGCLNKCYCQGSIKLDNESENSESKNLDESKK